jgi:predicted transcriptional regulator of viral defense system
MSWGWKERHIESVIKQMESEFTIGQLLNLCPDISPKTISKVLSQLRITGLIECVGRGRHSYWRKLI